MPTTNYTFLDKTSRFEMPSVATGATYDIQIALPAGYAPESRKYPLLLTLDGNFNFGTAAETAALQALMGETHPIIVVGIGTAADPGAHWLRRFRDYSPGPLKLSDGEADNPTAQMVKRRLSAAGLSYDEWLGHAHEFSLFLKDELLPRLLKELAVDPGEIAIYGHSLGGACLTYILLQKELPCTKFIIGSFGLVWYAPGVLAEMESDFRSRPGEKEVSIYCGFGGAELEDANISLAFSESSAFLDRLAENDPKYRITRQIFEGQGHGSSIACLLGSGIRHMWKALSYSEAAKER